MFFPKKAGRDSLKKRSLRLETLEKREMLSVTPVSVTGAMVTIYRDNDQIIVAGENAQQFYTGDIADIEQLSIQSTDGLAKVITVDMGRGGAFDFVDGLHIQGSDGEGLENIVKLVGSNQDNTFLMEKTQVTLNSLVVTVEDISSLRLEGGEADDTYRVLGLTLNTTIYDAGGVNHLDFSSYTSAQEHGVTVSLASTAAQQIFADDPLHKLTLGTSTSIRNLTGSQYTDTLRGNNLNNVIYGGGGADTIHGGAGADTIYGEAGDDTIYAESGNNAIYAGGGGANRVFGGTGNDRIFGSTGNDRLEAGSGNNLIVGGGGNDILTASDGRNVIIGGAGEDVLTTGEDESIVITGQTAYDDYTQASSRAALEAIYATWISTDGRETRVTALRDGVGDGGDVVLDATTVTNDGGDVSNTIYGAAGKNWIFASQANDELNGVTENDGKDVINEGSVPEDPDPEPEPGGDDYQALAALEAAMAGMLESGGVSALAFTVTENGELLVSLRAGVVNPVSEAELTPGTLYPIGSLYNLVVTAGIMKLVENEQLSLDAKVVTLLEEMLADEEAISLEIPEDSNLRDVTVRMLLNGSSGLPDLDYAADTSTPARSTYLANVLSYLSTLENAAIQPGTQTQDGDTGFLLAEFLIRGITDQSLAEFITDEFLVPADITGFVWGAEEVIAKQDSVAKAGAELVWANRSSDGGGVYATQEAVAKFLGIFTGTTIDADDQPLLSEESIQAVSANQLAEHWRSETDATWNNAIAPGLGWDCVADPVLDALGISAWIQTSLVGENLTMYLVVPEYGFILTASAVLNPEAAGEAVNADTLRSLLTDTLVDILEEKEVAITFPDAITYDGEAVDLPENFADTYAGYYAAYGEIIQVRVSNDGKLVVSTRTPAGQANEVVYEYREDAEGNGYFVPAGNESTNLQFTKDGDTIYIVTTFIDTTYGIAEISSISHQKLNSLVWEEIWDAADVAQEDREAATETWLADRVMKMYALQDDFYSSQSLAQPQVRFDYDPELQGLILVEFEGGYYVFRIVDENTAVPVLDLPGAAGKQLPAMVFTGDTAFTLGNVKYQQADAFSVLPEEAGSQTYPSGQWLRVPAPAEGDTELEITVPERSRVLIFDAAFNLLRDEFINDDTFSYDVGEELLIYVISYEPGQWEITRKEE